MAQDVRPAPAWLFFFVLAGIVAAAAGMVWLIVLRTA